MIDFFVYKLASLGYMQTECLYSMANETFMNLQMIYYLNPMDSIKCANMCYGSAYAYLMQQYKFVLI